MAAGTLTVKESTGGTSTVLENGSVAVTLTTQPEIPLTYVAGLPWLTLSPIGTATAGITLANNGADFGPDTASTTTNGWKEAIATAMITGNQYVIRVLCGTHTVDWTQLGTLSRRSRSLVNRTMRWAR